MLSLTASRLLPKRTPACELESCKSPPERDRYSTTRGRVGAMGHSACEIRGSNRRLARLDDARRIVQRRVFEFDGERIADANAQVTPDARRQLLAEMPGSERPGMDV